MTAPPVVAHVAGPAAPPVRVLAARLWPWARTLAGLVILAVLAWRLGASAFLDGVRLVTASDVLAALGIGLVTTVCCAWRWRLVARRLRLPLRRRTALADYYQALFLNAVLPAGVLGDAHRAVRHGRDAGDLGRGVRAVVLERAGGQVVLIAAGALALLADPGLRGALAAGMAPAPGAVTVLAALGALAVLGAVAVPAVRLWRRTAAASRLRATLEDVRRGLLARDAWPGVLALSAVALAGHVTLFLVAARAAGAAAPAGRLLPLSLLALLAMALPVNVGGFGPREALSALAFGAAGLGAEQGLSVAVVYGVLAFAASLPGAAVLMLRRGAGSRRAGPSGAQHLQVPAERRDQVGEDALALGRRGE
ncbi:uncharacterized membrane protein YbhN (UPF0104 family) [Thermocatellispora tengchongensis]|uniref:Uncharacterized membrane protein YbhN (UPF0104 family) n=1 Tax=Thermocatellispora tengchongensis TaxID=1073253 RepID=A0A840NXB5_9ACTN|nr:lysylphosphatidylglycerol synthase transmembrane domain-containing protein [Thermocatellispora tengchongensis]MBB5133494.1 uncharacterized membrane protein YbhN (UPF0104 family) [Thermocatellispora tengchongensis]